MQECYHRQLKLPQVLNPLNAELNPICHFLALLGAHPILHVSRIRVKNYHLCVTQGSFHVVTHHAYASVTAWLLKTKALSVPAFDRIAGLCNRHLNSNRGICFRLRF